MAVVYMKTQKLDPKLKQLHCCKEAEGIRLGKDYGFIHFPVNKSVSLFLRPQISIGNKWRHE